MKKTMKNNLKISEKHITTNKILRQNKIFIFFIFNYFFVKKFSNKIIYNKYFFKKKKINYMF